MATKEYRDIKIEDIVFVHFSNGDELEAIVKHIPSATGDSWHFQSTSDGNTWYIQQFESMELKGK